MLFVGIQFDASHTCGKVTLTKRYGYSTSLCVTFRALLVTFLYLFTQDRTQMLEITHMYTAQTTTYKLRVAQPLMMVLTLNCKYYKNITYCTAMEIHDRQYKDLKLMYNYTISASNAHILSNSSLLL